MVEAAQTFVELLEDGASKERMETMLMGFTGGEAVKGVAKSDLGLRVE